jgi:integrase
VVPGRGVASGFRARALTPDREPVEDVERGDYCYAEERSQKAEQGTCREPGGSPGTLRSQPSPPAASQRPLPATAPEDVAKVIAEGRDAHPEMALYLWLVAITGARRGELCALQVRDIDLERGILHIAFNYVVVGGHRVRKDTKTHQDRYLAIDPVTCAMIREHLDTIRAALVDFGLQLPEDAYVFSNEPMGAKPWNPDWVTHKASDLAAAAGVKLSIKGLRH